MPRDHASSAGVCGGNIGGRPAAAAQSAALERPARSDCVVVGAGLIGLSTALHLGRAGMTVRVLERGRIGDGTSGKASGWISAQLRTPNSLLSLVLASLGQYRSFLEELGDDCGYERSGSLVVFDSAEQIEQRRALDGTQREVVEYPGATFLDAAEVHAVEPELGGRIVGAAYVEGDAQVEPLRLLDAMVRAARSAGVTVHQGAEVTSLARADGAWRAMTPIGPFEAPKLVVTAGAWSPAVAALADLDVPVIPVSGQLLVSEPARRAVRHCVVYQPDPRFATRLACGVRPAIDGRLWLGTTYRAGSFDASVTETDTRSILTAVGEVFPSLRGLVIEQAWAGVRPVPADLVPIYGPLGGAEDAFAGVPVAGLAECPAAGRLLSEIVRGIAPSIDPTAYSPERFAAGADG